MPIFEYFCEECQTTFEKFLHSGTDPLSVECCKNCAGTKIKLKFSPVLCNTIKDGKHTYHDEILKDVDKIYKRLSKGSDADFNDVAGD